ncbi:MAG: hypothetical protein RL547_1355, partial [Actinomycetota bacterium]
MFRRPTALGALFVLVLGLLGPSLAVSASDGPDGDAVVQP